ncbi:MAG: sugar phosphate nucleotidyltransferase [Anaerolineaceae bacterium]|nr:sugar phosphate nucleotidyltransferase [Anaerolineaceae bacterium]MDD4577171.1 sugar phosphate nucleotidyltransferase [Anaerolineaceae bacterium]
MNYALIMAGGAGTRLWPLSREKHSKPSLSLYSDRSMFQIAVERLYPLFSPEQILVVASQEHVADLVLQVPEIPQHNYIIEPEMRGTASAIGLAAIHLAQRDPEATMAVLTADHHIGKPEVFRGVVEAALELAQAGYMVTLGITPTWPSTDYGYIEQDGEAGKAKGFKAYHAARFVEKPNLNNAQKMLALGNYSWNSGMFIWKVPVIMAEFHRQMPELHSSLVRIASLIGKPEYETEMPTIWNKIVKQTIDYGVMEHAERVVVIPADMDWLDVGTWLSLKSLLAMDEKGNSVRGDALLMDSENVLVMGDMRLVTGIGLKDLIIVDTPDALMVCDLNHSGQVRELVRLLKEQGRTDLV